MPQHPPLYSKLIFISYDGPGMSYDGSVNGFPKAVWSDIGLKCRNIAIWIYQRLKYAGLPVQTYGVDNFGGSNFSENNIHVTSPMIAVVSSASSKNRVIEDMRYAQIKNKEIFVAIAENDAEIPNYVPEDNIFDFHTVHDADEAFDKMRNMLKQREYPARRNPSDPDGERWLKEARERVESPDYFYLNVFHDIYNKPVKIQALRDLGRKRILSGLVAAVLQDDPQDAVRAEAAFALAKFEGYDPDHYLYNASRSVQDSLVSLYVDLAQTYRRDKKLIQRIVTDLQDVLLDDPNLPPSGPVEKPALTAKLNSRTYNNQHQIFISYARKDAENIAIGLANKLQDKGYEIWIDTKLEPGTPIWTRAIKDAIQLTRIVIVLLSPAVHDSRWVEEEITCAREFNKEIIPIMAIKTEKPFGLKNIQGLRGDPALSEEPDIVFNLLIGTLNQKGIKARN